MKDMELKIYSKDGTPRLTASPDSSSTLTEEVGGECALSLSFTTYEYAELQAGDHAEVLGVRYSLLRPYRPVQKDTQTYQYSLKMYAPIHDAERAMMLNLTDGQDEPEFALDGGPREHLRKWVDNMNRLAGQELWSIGTVLTAPNKTIEYTDMTCWDAAFGSNGIAATFETEMWADGYVINLCKAERGERVELGYMQGLQTLEPQETDGVRFFTRLFPLGPTRNIDPEKYGSERLRLPGGAKYVDLNTDRYGLYEATEEDAFSELYPQYTGAVSSVRTETKKNEQGKDYTVYYVKDGGMPFEPSEYEIGGLVKHVVFQSGDLNGRDFEANWHKDTKEWEIINQYPSDGVQLPGGELVPRAGDKYIPYNFRMPDEYVSLAEQAFKKAVDDYLKDYSIDTTQYGGQTDYIYIGKHDVPLRIGQNVRLLSDRYFQGGHRDTRVTKVVRKLQNLNDATVTCSDKTGTGWKQGVDSSLQDIKYQMKKQGEFALDIIKTTDTKTPSDSNVYSALKALATFLRKDTDDFAGGLITFLKGIRLGNNYSVGADGKAVLDEIRSQLFDAAAQTGYGMVRENGKFKLFVNALEVWGKAVFHELEIRKLSYAGGNIVLSPSGGTVIKVDEERDKDGTLTGWKCWLMQDDGTTATMNMWRKHDQAKCQTFNIKKSGTYQDAANRYYWRLVTEVSTTETVITDKDGNELYDGRKFGYIVLSATDYDKSSTDAPQAGDVLVLDGNRTDTERQNLLMLETLGDAAPAIVGYANVYDYTHEGKVVFSIGPSGVKFVSEFFQWISSDGTERPQQVFRGPWVENANPPYTYYHVVTHEGCTWLCIVPSGETATEEPSPWSEQWEMIGGDTEMKVTVTGAGTFTAMQVESSVNEQGVPVAFTTLGIEARLYNRDITDRIEDRNILWTRDTDNAKEDEAWNARHQNGQRTLPVSRDDLAADYMTRPTTFTATVTYGSETRKSRITF